MTEDSSITTAEYIKRSMAGAWQLARANPKAMQYFDLSSDGFWKSFLAIAVMVPIFALKTIYGLQSGEPVPIVSEGLYFILSLPFTAFVMIYFTKFMKISAGYASMVIAYNWLNAFNYCLLVIAGLLLNLVLPDSQVSSIIILLLGFYFGLYVVWFMFKSALKIGGLLAIGVLLFENILNSTLQIILLRIFDTEVFNGIFNSVNNLPA